MQELTKAQRRPDYTPYYNLFVDDAPMSAAIKRRKTHAGKMWIKVAMPREKITKFIVDLIEGYYRVHENTPETISWKYNDDRLIKWVDAFCEEKGCKKPIHLIHG